MGKEKKVADLVKKKNAEEYIDKFKEQIEISWFKVKTIEGANDYGYMMEILGCAWRTENEYSSCGYGEG